VNLWTHISYSKIIHDSRIKKGFLPPEYSSVPLGYGMPPPKIIGQVLQKKYCERNSKKKKEEKNNVAKEKKNTFLFEILAAYTTRYSPEDPLRAKKRTKSPSLSSSNLSHWCYYFMKERKDLPTASPCSKSLTSYLFKPTERG